MGFPVPLREWYQGPIRDFVLDIFAQQKQKSRDLFQTDAIMANFSTGSQFSRKTWGLLSLEIWQQLFIDRAADYRNMLNQETPTAPSSSL